MSGVNRRTDSCPDHPIQMLILDVNRAIISSLFILLVRKKMINCTFNVLMLILVWMLVLSFVFANSLPKLNPVTHLMSKMQQIS